MDWTDPSQMVTPHFSLHDCLWLPSWKQLAVPSIPEQTNLLALCALLEQVRSALGDKPIRIHCMLRPAAYNSSVGGAPRSAHIEGMAADFDVQGLVCDDVRATLEPLLESLNCRMECNPGSDWVHLDLAQVTYRRYFVP
jgi:uncharacterized protein YcbK (DUF882 family)